MKRFAVLFGLLALVIVTCGQSFATAPSVRDLPALRLQPGGAAGKGLADIPQVQMDAYDVMDFVKDSDNVATELTVSIVSPDITVDVDGAAQVADATEVLIDVYGNASAAWAEYTVRVDDGDTFAGKGAVGSDAIIQTAVVKYATFTLTAPIISDGLVLGDGGNTLSGWPFVYTWVGVGDATGELASLMNAIDPASASDVLTWGLDINEVLIGTATTDASYDDNGNWLGIELDAVGNDGASGIWYTIDSSGVLRLTSAGVITGGPWLLGIKATYTADNWDGSRMMVAAPMLPTVTTTLGNSVTLDDLTPGTVPACDNWQLNVPNVSYEPVGSTDLGVNIDTVNGESTWRMETSGVPGAMFDNIDIEIVDLASDGDLPAAAAAVVAGDAENAMHIAGGNAIKATLNPVTDVENWGPRGVSGTYQADGTRLLSDMVRADPGQVYSFSLSIATDAQGATDLPDILMALASGDAASNQSFLVIGHYGFNDTDERGNMTGLGCDPGSLGGTFEFTNNDVGRRALPLADDGWLTLTVNYTPGSTESWFVLAFEAATGTDFPYDNLDFQAALDLSATRYQESAVNVWVDNLRVYQSAYALDLALEAEALTETAACGDSEYLANVVFLAHPEGDLDGSFESLAESGDWAADLDALGFALSANSASGSPEFRHPDASWLDLGEDLGDLLSVGGFDHTRNGGSSKCLALTLPSDSALDGADGASGDLQNINVQIQSGAVAGSGDGLYAMEIYLSAAPNANADDGNLHPIVKAVVAELGPNFFGSLAGTAFAYGGLPSISSDVPGNWARVVGETYIKDCTWLTAALAVWEDFKGDVANYDVPIYADDFQIYRIDDPAMYFDSDVFGG